jgi:hypothetical protein
MVSPQKTGRSIPFEITEPTKEILAVWLAQCGRRPDGGLFSSLPSGRRAHRSSPVRQARRSVGFDDRSRPRGRRDPYLSTASSAKLPAIVQKQGLQILA